MKEYPFASSLEGPQAGWLSCHFFFQRNWHIIDLSVIQVIQEIFENITILKDSGITNLVPIPKVPHPDMITNFQPINLCNTLYKLVSRIILQRLKTLYCKFYQSLSGKVCSESPDK